jgi:hypothetical protein
MGLKSPRSTFCSESLDCGRRTDTKSGDKAKRTAGNFWCYYKNPTDKQWDWPKGRTTEHSGMGHGADRTLMAGNPGIVSVNVDCLDDADEADEKDA